MEKKSSVLVVVFLEIQGCQLFSCAYNPIERLSSAPKLLSGLRTPLGCPTLPARMRASATQRLDQDLKFQPTPIIRRSSSTESDGDEEGFVALLLLFFGWKLL